MLEKLKEKLTNKNLLLGVIGVLLIGGTAVGGYWYLNREKPEENGENVNNNQSNPSTSDTDLKAGWKKYTNSTLGFSIEYPDDWMIEENYEISQGYSSIVFQNLDPQDYPVEGIFYKTPEHYRRLSIGISTEAGGKTIKEYYESIGTDEQVGGFILKDTVEEVVVASLFAKRAIEDFEGKHSVYYIPKPDFSVLYKVSGSHKDNETYELYPELKQMLDSFKIL